MEKVRASATRILSGFFVFMIVLLLFSAFLQAAEYTSLYTYYGLPSYAYGSNDIFCDEGLLNDDRYTSCEQSHGVNIYRYTLMGFREIYDLTDSRVICHRDESLGGSDYDGEESFSLTYPTSASPIPGAFRLFIPPGTVKVKVSIKMCNTCADGIVMRYQSVPDCLDWPYSRFEDVPWEENQMNVGLETMKDRDVYKLNPDGSIFVVPLTEYRSPLTVGESGWLYVRELGLDYSAIRRVAINITVDSAVFLDWYLNARWDAAGDPWSADHGVISTPPRPSPTPTPQPSPTPTPQPSLTPTPSISANNGLFGGLLDQFSGTSSGSSSTPTSSVSTENSGSTNTLGLPAVFSFNSRDEQLSCGPDHLEVCDREACEEILGEGFWWYDGSCRDGQQYEVYAERIAEAPVRLGADANDGLISIGEGMSVEVDIPGAGRTYAMLVFPNGDYFFIDNDALITNRVVPVSNGVMPVSDDICAALAELPEDIKGEWEVLIFTVPSVAPEFQVIEDIASYIEDEGVYHFGSYSVMVSCQARSNSPLSIFGVFQ